MMPRLCFVGPMIGRNPGQVTTQAEVQADLFRQKGWVVRETSRSPQRWLRPLDMVWCLVRWRSSIDVVVLSVFSGPAFVVADLVSWCCRPLRLPVIAVLHGGNLPGFEARHARWVRRVLDRAQVVVTPSAYLAAEVVAARGRALVIPNVVDLDAYEYVPRTSPDPSLLWMRTFHHLYNPSMAVRVLDRLRRTVPDVSLTMAGQDKGALDETKIEAEHRSLGGAITFPGFLDADQKRRALAEHDIYLHTNHVDNAPVSVLEAAASGLVIVATAVGGIPWLLEDGISALLVPDDDPDAMARAVTQVLDDPALAARLSSGGRQLAEASSWPRVLDSWVAVFDAIEGSGWTA